MWRDTGRKCTTLVFMHEDFEKPLCIPVKPHRKYIYQKILY